MIITLALFHSFFCDIGAFRCGSRRFLTNRDQVEHSLLFFFVPLVTRRPPPLPGATRQPFLPRLRHHFRLRKTLPSHPSTFISSPELVIILPLKPSVRRIAS